MIYAMRRPTHDQGQRNDIALEVRSAIDNKRPDALREVQGIVYVCDADGRTTYFCIHCNNPVQVYGRRSRRRRFNHVPRRDINDPHVSCFEDPGLIDIEVCPRRGEDVEC